MMPSRSFRLSSFPLRALLLGLAVALVVGWQPTAASAQEANRVAAVVNEEAISMQDLEMRVRLSLMASNLPDSVETRSRVAPQVLRRLVDERLQIQEADRLKITIPGAEIANGVASIERQNNMPKGALEPMLKSKGIDIDTLRQQVRAELSWQRVVRRELANDIHIGEEEVDQRLDSMKANLGKPEFLAADIFLAVEDPRHEEEIHNLALRLLEQMKQGAPFSSLARQFSQSGGSAGGDLGWISEGMLDDELMAALQNLAPGTVTPPIRTIDGYHILLLRDKRIAGANVENEASFDIGLIFMTSTSGADTADRQQQLDRLKQAVAGANKCEDYERRIPKLPNVEWSRPGRTKASQIPADVMAIINQLQPGGMSAPVENGLVRRFFVMCERIEPSSGLPSRDDLRHRIEDERLELMSRRYLRDIRRAAFVEIRI